MQPLASGFDLLLCFHLASRFYLEDDVLANAHVINRGTHPMFFMLLETAFPWGSSKAGKGMMLMESSEFQWSGYRLVF